MTHSTHRLPFSRGRYVHRLEVSIEPFSNLCLLVPLLQQLCIRELPSQRQYGIRNGVQLCLVGGVNQTTLAQFL